MKLQELSAKLGLDEEEYRELIELFVLTGGSDFKELEAAIVACDANQVMRRAHTIKGASGNLGLMEVFETARTIEERAGNLQLDGLTQAVETLKAQLEAIQNFIHGPESIVN